MEYNSFQSRNSKKKFYSSLALPHRAQRYSAVKKSHLFIGLLILFVILITFFLFRKEIWGWQTTQWKNLINYFSINVDVSGSWFGWEQYFIILNWKEMIISTILLILITWIFLKLPLTPPFKGFYLIIVIPIYLFCLVTFIIGKPPVGVLDHLGPEWLYGELVLWILIPLIYVLFIFPPPFSIGVKLLSFITIMLISIAWRTVAPVVYVLIAVNTKGLLAIPAWMLLGPWADYFYIVPIFSATLYAYKGDKRVDIRS